MQNKSNAASLISIFRKLPSTHYLLFYSFPKEGKFEPLKFINTLQHTWPTIKDQPQGKYQIFSSSNDLKKNLDSTNSNQGYILEVHFITDIEEKLASNKDYQKVFNNVTAIHPTKKSHFVTDTSVEPTKSIYVECVKGAFREVKPLLALGPKAKL